MRGFVVCGFPNSLTNGVYVSAVAGWEIAIKASPGRLETTRSVIDAVTESGFEELPVRLAHAREEGLTLVSRDDAIAQYDVRLLRI